MTGSAGGAAGGQQNGGAGSGGAGAGLPLVALLAASAIHLSGSRTPIEIGGADRVVGGTAEPGFRPD
jgi:hypothetical protein